MATFGPGSMGMHLRKKEVRIGSSLMVNAKNCNDVHNSDTKSTEERWREKQIQCQKNLKTNIIKMCVKVKLVVSMNKHSNVY